MQPEIYKKFATFDCIYKLRIQICPEQEICKKLKNDICIIFFNHYIVLENNHIIIFIFVNIANAS